MQNLKKHTLVSVKQRLKRCRRRAFELCGSARYSRPSLNDLDRKLERYLDFDDGFFIEAGANDGYEQSNTYYFEKMRGWNGILIEPMPEFAADCRENRSSPVIEAALVAKEVPRATIVMHYSGLMSVCEDAQDRTDTVLAHVNRGLYVQGLTSSYTVSVSARTLSGLLDEAGVTREIDLLSLDVEGAEPTALQGIDFERHCPRYICVESRNKAEIERVLCARYRLVEELNDNGEYQDLLYARL